MILQNLSFLIVCPDQAARHRLRTVIKTFVYKGHIDYEKSTRFALDRFKTSTYPYDVLLLASSFGKSEISNFLIQLDAVDAPVQPPVLIFVNDDMHSRSSEIASLYVEGIAGFIAEPYTADELLGIITVVKKQSATPTNEGLKQVKAMEFLLLDAIKNVDDLWRRTSVGDERRNASLKELRRLSSYFKKFAEGDIEHYGEIACRMFEKASPASEFDLQRKARSTQKQVPHPGATVRYIMEQRGLSEERLLSIVHVDQEIITALLREEHPIDLDLARELSRALGMAPSEWLKMQQQYDAFLKKAAIRGV